MFEEQPLAAPLELVLLDGTVESLGEIYDGPLCQARCHGGHPTATRERAAGIGTSRDRPTAVTMTATIR